MGRDLYRKRGAGNFRYEHDPSPNNNVVRFLDMSAIDIVGSLVSRETRTRSFRISFVGSIWNVDFEIIHSLAGPINSGPVPP